MARCFPAKPVLAMAAALGCGQASVFLAGTATAAPVQLACTLSHIGDDGKAVSRPLAIVFDGETNTIGIDDTGAHSDLAHVRISTISVNGYNDRLSLGIERSSLALVLQHYDAQAHSTAEFGSCKIAPPQK